MIGKHASNKYIKIYKKATIQEVIKGFVLLIWDHVKMLNCVLNLYTDLGALFFSHLDLFLHKPLSVCSLIKQPPLDLLSPLPLGLELLLPRLNFFFLMKRQTGRLRHRGALNLQWEDLIGDREKNYIQIHKTHSAPWLGTHEKIIQREIVWVSITVGELVKIQPFMSNTLCR